MPIAASVNSELLKRLRQERKLSVQGLATELDMDRKTLARFEKDPPKHASVYILSRLAAFYERRLDDLVVFGEPA